LAETNYSPGTITKLWHDAGLLIETKFKKIVFIHILDQQVEQAAVSLPITSHY
jgi:hypothetical protein